MPGIVQFVVDTNLFHECKALDAADFDWSAVGDFDEIELVVCGVVQSELDRQKKDTRSRVKKRAIKAVGWFRTMLLAGANSHVFREAGPRVTMWISPARASQAHPEILDLDVNDDRIVGVAVALAAAEPMADIRLLTDDTGPAGKANALGLPFDFIPVDWKREPELDDQARENRDLKAQLAALRMTQPQIEVSADGAVNRKLAVQRAAWAELEPAELPSIRERLLARFPLDELERKFAAKASERRPGAWQFGIGNITVVPVAPEATARYRDETYPAWLDACLSWLESVPDLINPALAGDPVTIRLVNGGGKPAEDVRIRFRARGAILIAPAGVEGKVPSLGKLPPAPKPPQETYLSAEGRPLGRVTPIRPADLPFAGLPRLDRHLQPREAEVWYYEPDRPNAPVDQYDLVCERFRHGGDEEAFELLIYPLSQAPVVTASIDVEVSATNLPQVVSVTFPVEIQTTFQPAGPLIEAVLKSENPVERAAAD
ncbi:MAG: hypothetical protein KL785_09800 [Brevundimonas sp.]|nr:hypothetical protein [Brevundimonas sp.]